jgi:hypothetical protein
MLEVTVISHSDMMRIRRAVSLYRKRTKRYSQAVSLYRKRTSGTHKRYLCTGNGQPVLTAVSLYRKRKNILTSGISIPETDKQDSQAGSLYWKWTNSTHKRAHCTGNGQTVLTSGLTVPEMDKQDSQAGSLYRKWTNSTHKRAHCTGNGQTGVTVRFNLPETDKRNHQTVTQFRKLKTVLTRSQFFRGFKFCFVSLSPLLPPTLSVRYKIYPGIICNIAYFGSVQL